MAKIVNREEQLVNSFDDLISLPSDDTTDEARASALGRDTDEKSNLK
ncbi:hypothetical protein [Leuconostoc rapi]|nr:hypothetical protein [Leuconostoc rapi]MBM7434867.1 hypothetical protein [Leuconostoc rapi]